MILFVSGLHPGFWPVMCVTTEMDVAFIYLVDFLKEPAFGFVDSLYCSDCFFLVDFCPEINYFLLSNPLGVLNSFCSRAPRCAVMLLL